MSVNIAISPTLQPGTPKPLFQTRMAGVNNTRNYVAAHDGKRFLIYTPPDDSQLEPINLILNWPVPLKRDTAGK
jgi:hypothetical protein